MSVAHAGRRAATKAANRTAILAAAQEVFAELGFGAATVRDIVRRTDLATGTFYNYFPDKESVFRALLDDSATEARARTRAARQGARTVEEFVISGYRAFFQYLVSDQQAFELMRRNAGTIRAMFDEPVLGAGTEELAADLRAAIDAGAIPGFLDWSRACRPHSAATTASSRTARSAGGPRRPARDRRGARRPPPCRATVEVARGAARAG